MADEQVVITLQDIAREVQDCTRCELCRSRTMAVPGEGDAHARIMLIGEGPGFNEDREGRPFIGASGKFLSELLLIAGVSREQVFIGNVVKCRPPGNRDPLPDEIAACAPYLDRQIAAIDPEVIVTLGRFSMARWFPGERITKIHGMPREVDGRLIVPMFHPAAALHQGAVRPLIEEDFRKLPKFLAEVEAKRNAAGKPDEPPPAQLGLF